LFAMKYSTLLTSASAAILTTTADGTIHKPHLPLRHLD